MKKLLNNLTISIKETIINQETFLIFFWDIGKSLFRHGCKCTKTANIAKSSPNYLEVCRKILIFATTNKSINRVLWLADRPKEAAAGGSVYLRSQPCAPAKERQAGDGARARSHLKWFRWRKRVLLSCIGIWRQVCMAVAHR